MQKILSVVLLLLTACGTSGPITTVTGTATMILPTRTPSPRATSTATALLPSATASPSPTLTASPTKAPTSAVYGAPQVNVAAGEFQMGSETGDIDEQPVHRVYLDAYSIDTFEVTNALYKACVDAGACTSPKQVNSNTRTNYYDSPEFNDYPVIYVDWNQAKTYCEWRGGSLPTEAQWEKAARGTDGRTYPWGEGIDCNRANYDKTISSSGEVGCPVAMPLVGKFVSYKLGDPSKMGVTVGDTTAVGSYARGISPYGAYDLAGNVWELVADHYSETYYQSSPASNPFGPEDGQGHVLRGGAFGDAEFNVRAAERLWEGQMAVPSEFVGFRCVRPVP
jgi:eukaryotic-like serine/threonine-protein kinase